MSMKCQILPALTLILTLLSISACQTETVRILVSEFRSTDNGSNEITPSPIQSEEIAELALPTLTDSTDHLEAELFVESESEIESIELEDDPISFDNDEVSLFDESQSIDESVVETIELENNINSIDIPEQSVFDEAGNIVQRIELENDLRTIDILNADWNLHQRGDLNFGHWIYRVDSDGYSLGDTLRVSALKGEHLGTGAYFDFPEATQEVIMSFCMRFGENWNSSIGGKLPGFSGNSGGLNGGQGGSPSNGDNAWSARMQFGKFDKVNDSVPLGFYIYHTDQSHVSRFGDTEWWANKPDRLITEAARVVKNRWYNITQRIQMNSAYQNNGVLESWIDDELVYSRDDLNFTNNEVFRQVHRFWLNFYVGGSVPAESDQTVFFSEFNYSFERVVPVNNCESLNLGSTFEPTADPIRD